MSTSIILLKFMKNKACLSKSYVIDELKIKNIIQMLFNEESESFYVKLISFEIVFLPYI